MHKIDGPRFSAAMDLCAIAIGKTVSKERKGVYWKALLEFQIEHVEKALQDWGINSTTAIFPLVNDIKTFIREYFIFRAKANAPASTEEIDVTKFYAAYLISQDIESMYLCITTMCSCGRRFVGIPGKDFHCGVSNMR